MQTLNQRTCVSSVVTLTTSIGSAYQKSELYQARLFCQSAWCWHVRTPTTQSQLWITLMQKNRNRTHQDQRSTGAMNLPWLRSLRGWNMKLLLVVVAVGDVRLRDVVYHTGSRNLEEALPAIIHCSIVQKKILKFGGGYFLLYLSWFLLDSI